MGDEFGPRDRRARARCFISFCRAERLPILFRAAFVPGAVCEFGHVCLGQVWRFRVSDNGIGFDPAQAHKLFTPFGRRHGPGHLPQDRRAAWGTNSGRGIAGPGRGVLFRSAGLSVCLFRAVLSDTLVAFALP
jgi:hypothetical protein